MSTDQISRELARLKRALTAQFGDRAINATDLFNLAHQLNTTPQGVVLFDRLVCAIRATQDED